MAKPETFLKRIIRLLGHESILDLTLASGIKYDDLCDLDFGTRGMTEAVDESETWQAVANHVDQRLAELLAAREELQRKLNNDRRKREGRRTAIANR